MPASAYPSLKVTKSFAFKGGTRLYSNRYHMLGGTPADSTHWTTLSDSVVTAEKAQTGNQATIVGTTGYAAGSDVPVFSKAYTTAGTFGGSAGYSPSAGEVAALTRYSTAGRTTKNHPIYLFNYYHAVRNGTSAGTEDLLDSGQRTAMATYAALWISGFSDGTHTLTRCGPNGDAALGAIVEEYCTHRDFPYTRSL
jgi:hypothetical protein